MLRHRFSVRYDQRVNLDNIPLGKGLTGAAAETREAVRVLDTATDPRYIASHPDIRSELAVPLVVQDRVVGVLDLESDRVSYFTEDHQRTLTLLAPQIASSVENARLYEELTTREQRMEQDLKAARKVQTVLLPRTAPELRGLEIALRSRPAREISRRRLRLLRIRRRRRRDCIRRRERQGRGGGLVRCDGQRTHAHPGAAPPQSRAVDEIAERDSAGAEGGRAVCHLLVALWRPAERKLVFANAGARAAPGMARRRDSEA